MRHLGPMAYATLITLSCLACGEDETHMTPAQEERAVEVGGQAARALVTALMGHLSVAMQEGGAPAAVRVCSEKALSLTDSVASELGEGITLKRTTLRYRNPLNAPDELDATALRRFEELQAGEEPAHLVFRTPRDYRYYVPIRMAPPCLQCHGKLHDMDPEVVRALSELYPDDRATGYEEGDFRGALRVSIEPALIEG